MVFQACQGLQGFLSVFSDVPWEFRGLKKIAMVFQDVSGAVEEASVAFQGISALL